MAFTTIIFFGGAGGDLFSSDQNYRIVKILNELSS